MCRGYGKSSATDQQVAKKESSEKDGLGSTMVSGETLTALEELRLEDGASFQNFLRMDPRMFHGLLKKIEQTLRSSIGVHCQYDALRFFMVL